MVEAVQIDATSEAGTVADLAAALRLRVQHLKEDTANATVAAAITILRSLKAATKKAPVKTVPPGSYEIVLTEMYGGLYRKPGSRQSLVCARIGSHYGVRSNILPAIAFQPGGRAVFNSRVYAIYTTNPYDTFAKNKNAPNKCWYVLAEHEGQAKDYAERHVLRMLNRESGMARYALAMAQAKASTRSEIVPKEQAEKSGNLSPRAAGLAYDAGVIEIDSSGVAEGVASVSFVDELGYSSPAAGGESALNDAISKATRAMVGYVERRTGQRFEQFHSPDVTNVQWSHEA